MSSTATWIAAGLTDRGRVRNNNEDSWLACPHHPLFAVADGMGGHGAGDVASKLALETLQRGFTELIHQHSGADSLSPTQSQSEPHTEITAEFPLLIRKNEIEHLITECVNLSNDCVYQENKRIGNPNGAGMGTTLVGFVLYREPDSTSSHNSTSSSTWEIASSTATETHATHALVFNVGDSRAYCQNTNGLTQLTTDHTLYEEWARSGRRGPPPPRNIITRALGLYPDVDVQLETISICDQPLFWLCSDGLSEMLSDPTLQQIADPLFTEPKPSNAALQSLCRAFVDAANHAGGRDNITVVAVQPRVAH